MPDLPSAHGVLKAAFGVAFDQVVLSYDDRFLRRKRLVTAQGAGFLVSLDETISVAHGDAFQLDDGRLIKVIAAIEPVMIITGDLPRFAWHIGNRHTPCQIEPDRLLIRQDHVLEAMLRQMGAGITHKMEPFTPEGGAYGHGRTMGHSHGDYDHAAFPFLNHAKR